MVAETNHDTIDLLRKSWKVSRIRTVIRATLMTGLLGALSSRADPYQFPDLHPLTASSLQGTLQDRWALALTLKAMSEAFPALTDPAPRTRKRFKTPAGYVPGLALVFRIESVSALKMPKLDRAVPGSTLQRNPDCPCQKEIRIKDFKWMWIPLNVRLCGAE